MMFLFLFLLTGLAHGQEVIIEYRDKPPYMYTESGRPTGFLIDKTSKIFDKADISYIYLELPAKRILYDIKENKSPICATGWYKSPERELFANFTLPIHHDRPHMILVGATGKEKIREVDSLKEILANKSLSMIKIDGVSYGTELDTMLRNNAVNIVSTTTTPLGLAKMIRYGRADYMVIDQDDYEYLNANSDLDAEGVTPLRFHDMPPGELRYIMCSKATEWETIQKLNRAIQQLKVVQKK